MPKELAVGKRRRRKHLTPGSCSMGITELTVEVPNPILLNLAVTLVISLKYTPASDLMGITRTLHQKCGLVFSVWRSVHL